MRVRHGKRKKWTTGSANVHTRRDTHGLFELTFEHLRAHYSTQGRTPSLSRDGQPPLLVRASTFSCHSKNSIYSKQGLCVLHASIAWECLQRNSWDCAQGATLGASWSSGTHWEGRGAVWQRQQSPKPEKRSFTWQKWCQLFSLQNSCVRREQEAPCILFLPKETHPTSLAELHVSPHGLDTKPELKQSVKDTHKATLSFLNQCCTCCQQVELLQIHKEGILV